MKSRVSGLALDSNAAAISELRTQVKQTQDSRVELEAALARARTPLDANESTIGQRSGGVQGSLAALVAVREEQRRPARGEWCRIQRHPAERALKWTRACKRSSVFWSRNAVAFNEATRRLGVVEIGLLEATRRSAALEAKAKTDRRPTKR
jgi:hypothetical protein